MHCNGWRWEGEGTKRRGGNHWCNAPRLCNEQRQVAVASPLIRHYYSLFSYSLFIIHVPQLMLSTLNEASFFLSYHLLPSLSLSLALPATVCLSFTFGISFFLSFLLFLSSSLIVISCVSLRLELSIEIARKTVQIEPRHRQRQVPRSGSSDECVTQSWPQSRAD